MLRPLRPLTLQWLYRGFNQRWSQHQALISKLVVSFCLLSKDRVLNSWTELSFSEGFLSRIQYSNDNILWQPIAFRSAKWARKGEFNECTQNSLIPPSHLTSSGWCSNYLKQTFHEIATVTNLSCLCQMKFLGSRLCGHFCWVELSQAILFHCETAILLAKVNTPSKEKDRKGKQRLP